jgi:dihydropyrimidinase
VGTPDSVLVRDGDVFAGGNLVRADVLLRGGEIVEIGNVGEVPEARVVDAAGKLVIPGAVDIHTHLDMEVGTTRSADDFYGGTRAAACGGTTTIVDFATAYRGESAAQGLETWHAKARGRAVVDYGFHMSVTEMSASSDELVAEMAAAGVTSFKLYMTYADRLMVPDEMIADVMAACGRAGGILCLHCEDDATVTGLRADALAAGYTAPIWHARTRPPASEALAVERAIRMSEATGAPVYIVHLSSAEALEHVRAARARGLPVFAETCPHYLFLSDELLDGDPEVAVDYVCSPPLRAPANAKALWRGLVEGDLQVVSTDHCPFTRADRRAGLGGGGWRDFTEIPGGLPGIETRLSLMYQKVLDGTLDVARWVDICCTAPARIFGLHPRKGELAVGGDADLVVFDPGATKHLSAENLHMRTDHSPYSGTTVTGWPDTVISGGRVLVEGGEPLPMSAGGRFLHRHASDLRFPRRNNDS